MVSLGEKERPKIKDDDDGKFGLLYNFQHWDDTVDLGSSALSKVASITQLKLMPMAIEEACTL